MPKQIQPHPKKMSSHDNATDNAKQMEVVGTQLKADTDPVIKAMGEDLLDGAVVITDSVNDSGIKHAAAEAATLKVQQNNVDGATLYNEVGAEIEKKFPNDSIKWKDYGYEVTSDMAHDQTLPDKVVNGIMIQGKYPKQCILQFEASSNSANFTVEITIADPSDPTKYILVKTPKMIFTTIKITFIVPDDYLGKNLWAKVTAHNSAGESPASDPFGGMKIQ